MPAGSPPPGSSSQGPTSQGPGPRPVQVEADAIIDRATQPPARALHPDSTSERDASPLQPGLRVFRFSIGGEQAPRTGAKAWRWPPTAFEPLVVILIVLGLILAVCAFALLAAILIMPACALVAFCAFTLTHRYEKQPKWAAHPRLRWMRLIDPAILLICASLGLRRPALLGAIVLAVGVIATAIAFYLIW